MTPLASAISGAIIHFIWQGALAGISLWIALYALRKHSANTRYIVCCAALAALAAMPVVTASVLYSAPSKSVSSAAASTTLAPGAGGIGEGNDFTRQWMNRMQPLVLPLWSLGVLFFSIRLIVGYRHAFLLSRRGTPGGEAVNAVIARLKKVMGVKRHVRVLISSMADSPSVIGWLRPVILLPAASLMGLTPLQLEAILAHEIAHIRRYDYLVNACQMLVETLLFYHPAVWWTSRRIRVERELSCDDLAVQFSGNALRYARALTTLEKLRLRTPSAVMGSTGGPLLFRIQRLLGTSAKEAHPSRLPVALAMVLGIVALTINVNGIQGQDARGVTVELGGAAVIHRTPVRYPESAQKEKIAGTVQVEVKLDSSGTVADARVLSGPEELRRAALESVLNWHFTSDSARAVRIVTISFADAGMQVQVQQPPMPPQNDVIELQLKRAELEARRAAEVRGRLAAELKARQMAVEEESLRARLNEVKLVEARLKAIGGNRFIGRPLREIVTPGLADDVRNDLIARLPVRVGDILSEQLWRETDSTIHNFDEHLQVGFILTDDGQVLLQIASPSERR